MDNDLGEILTPVKSVQTADLMGLGFYLE